MAENKEGVNGILEKLALLTDATQNLFPNGKTALIFELNEVDYNFMRINLNKFGNNEQKFKIDISGVEIIFILEDSFKPEEETIVDEPKKKSLVEKLRSFIGRKSSI